jgi:signal transduction histidine kinase
MFLLLSYILFTVTYIGFREIGHSYDKAYEYAKKLEKLNENLEDEVAKKTEKIKEAYAVQSDVMHKQAVLGHITQALLHDIATPMSVILGNVKLLKKSVINNEELELLESSVLQMDSLIENSKKFIKRDGNIEIFSLKESFNNALIVFEKRISSASIKISLDISDNLVLRGISSLFIRFVSNILINAIEELENTKKKSKRIDISAKETGDHIVIQIKDNGNGIPNEMVSQIFAPDFSSKDDMHLGFGLSFVKDIVERRFGGTVEVDTIFGKYTNFVITLPKEFEYEEV